MDLVHERASVIVDEKEDRISNLPHDIFHHILCFLDMKYAVQICTLSKTWKQIWTSMPNINLNSFTFPTLPQFCDFVEHALSHRNNGTEVYAVDLTFTGILRESVVESIVNYAYLHNVKKLNLTLFSDYVCVFPQQIFSSHTLKHLSIVANPRDSYFYIISYADWDFPVLETLIMKNLLLWDYIDKNVNLFSKCVNLKELTLHGCSSYGSGIYNICAPQLSSLTIAGRVGSTDVLNVVASHLQNLTLTITSTLQLDFLDKSPEGLKKVNLSLLGFGYRDEIYLPVLLDLFPKLHGAKYLILDWGIIETLSSYLDQLPHEPPNAIFIMDQPQVPQKRSMVNTDAKLDEGKSQLAELKSKVQMLKT